MLESIEIIECFDDLNKSQKYQLKVPLYRNDKQYITELENNVNYFMNQIGKNNYITPDQMEVIMPKYVAREKKKRVNRAKLQADRIKKEVEQLKQEERIYGKATFQFANELPKLKQQSQEQMPFYQRSTQSLGPQEFYKYISTNEYKDYRYQYKPYIPSSYEQSISQRQLLTIHPQIDLQQNVMRGSQSSKSVYEKNILSNPSQQDSLLLEKSQAYLLEHSKMQNKWQSAFKNIDSIDKRKQMMSQDNLMKQYKQPSLITNNPLRNKNLEPSEDEILVSNNNIQINDLLNNIKLKNTPNQLKTPENYIFQEFMQLSKQSLDTLNFQNDFSNNKSSTLKEESKKLNIKLHKLKNDQGKYFYQRGHMFLFFKHQKDLDFHLKILNLGQRKKTNYKKIYYKTDKFILFKILKNHFQPILERNKAQIMTRIFLALDINPHEEFSKVKWREYHLFNKIVIDQSASVIEQINFIVKFFGIHDQKYMRSIDFLALLRVVCSKFDEFLISKGRTTIFDLLEQNLLVLGLIRHDSEYLRLNEFRALLLSHRINYSILLKLIVLTL